MPRLKQPETLAELYPEISVDAIGDMSIDRLLLMSREDFLELSKYDFVQSKLLSVYRFMLYSNKAELRNGTASVADAIDKAVLVRESSDTALNHLRTKTKSKKNTPRSPKRKKPKKCVDGQEDDIPQEN